MGAYLTVALVAAVTFGLCFLADKGYTKIFRSREQHRSGLSVRFPKRYATVGIVLAVLGAAALMAGVPETPLVAAAGGILVAVGAALVVYYMSFGIFYDGERFLFSTFGKRSVTYAYRDIKAQRLYQSYAGVLIELYLTDGRTVQLQSGMEGVYPFLDSAYEAWLRQTGRREEDCPFHDPDNSRWFPDAEE